MLTARSDFRSIAFAFAAFCPIALHAQLYDSQHPHTVPIQLSADERATAGSLAVISAGIDTRVKEGLPVVVFNPLAWQRGGAVEVSVQLPSGSADKLTVLDDKNNVVPSEILTHDPNTHTARLLLYLGKVPSMGYRVLHVVESNQNFPSDLTSKGTTLENANLRVVIDPQTGCITSLFDKRTQFETLVQGGCGNELQAFKDTPKDYDAWNIDPATLDVAPTRIHNVDSVQMIENTPFRSTIRVARTWQNSKFVQDLTLSAGSDEVLVTNDIDWHETHILLKAAFPLATSSDSATYEIPYGTIDRPTTRNNSFDKARFEVPALRWADLGDRQHGFSLINTSKYGYDAVGNLLRLTLLRSPVWPDPDADRGPHHFIYVLYPHASTWQQALTEERGYDANYSLRAMQVEPHEGLLPPEHSFLVVDNDQVVVTAMKKAEDGDALIIRFYEWAGKAGRVKLTVPPGASAASVVNLMEKTEGALLPITSDSVSVDVTPYEIQTVRIAYKPARDGLDVANASH